MRHLRALSAVIVWTLVLVSSMPAPASAASALPEITDPAPFGCIDSDDPAFTVCTNDTTGASAPDSVVVDYLIELVDAAGSSDSIRISMFQWWYQKAGNPTFDYSTLEDLVDSIIAADGRGVDVEILIDDVSDPSENSDLVVAGVTQPFTQLTSALGSAVTVCGNDSACLANGNPNAINHNKFFLFEINGDQHVVLTSTNLVPNAQNAYENLIHIRDDEGIYDFLLGYWDRLKTETWGGWTTAADREEIGDHLTKAYVNPRYEAEGNDTVLEILEGITACPDAYNRKVWISMSAITSGRLTGFDNAILDAIGDLDAMGCAVKFVVDDVIPTGVIDDLEAEGAEVVVAPSLHHKFIIVDATSVGRDGTSPQAREFVWTGSHNMTWSSAWRDGESAVWIEEHDVVRAYVSHFTCLWNRNRLTSSDSDDDC